ncbi:fibroblast growth factor receptor homolog 1-like [Bradysia coprophila]|uniref:fibroblast growth factor receptor homolog 1-like n=1 Tax=Bradysia coprophila TaxID=38358 RepID=UPI00187D9971|nr:fibroblast growth factor receptor homolog 1-like [Bradysia coprophila]
MLNIRCAADGNPEPSIAWTKDSNDIHRIDEVKTRGWTLILKKLSSDDSGHYTCELCNIHGCISHTTHVLVEGDEIVANKHSNKSNQRPRFSKPEQLNQKILKPSGHMLNIRCAATGDPEPIITWTKDSDVIDRIGEVKTRGWTLVLKDLSSDDSGDYTCELCNMHGCISHTTHVLVEGDEIVANKPNRPPRFSQPEQLNQKILKPSGHMLNIRCAATGYPEPIITWTKDSDVIDRIGEVETLRWTLILKNLSSDDSGHYTCELCNIHGCISHTTQLLVEEVKSTPINGKNSTFWLLVLVTVLVASICLVIILKKPFHQWPFRIIRSLLRINSRDESDFTWEIPRDRVTLANVIGTAREIDIMKNIGKHKNIVNLLGCCTHDGGPPYAIIEYAHKGNLSSFLRENRRLTLKQLISFANQVARGMEHLASINCIHRDLAARNVLVFRNNIVKIADFGLARYGRRQGAIELLPIGEQIPFRLTAPEALMTFFIIHESSTDVWSYGVLLWEIMSLGAVPYPEFDSKETLYNYLEDGNRLDKPPGCPRRLYKLMQQCWKWQPQERPLFEEIRC